MYCPQSLVLVAIALYERLGRTSRHELTICISTTVITRIRRHAGGAAEDRWKTRPAHTRTTRRHAPNKPSPLSLRRTSRSRFLHVLLPCHPPQVLSILINITRHEQASTVGPRTTRRTESRRSRATNHHIDPATARIRHIIPTLRCAPFGLLTPPPARHTRNRNDRFIRSSHTAVFPCRCVKPSPSSALCQRASHPFRPSGGRWYNLETRFVVALSVCSGIMLTDPADAIEGKGDKGSDLVGGNEISLFGLIRSPFGCSQAPRKRPRPLGT